MPREILKRMRGRRIRKKRDPRELRKKGREIKISIAQWKSDLVERIHRICIGLLNVSKYYFMGFFPLPVFLTFYFLSPLGAMEPSLSRHPLGMLKTLTLLQRSLVAIRLCSTKWKQVLSAWILGAWPALYGRWRGTSLALWLGWLSCLHCEKQFAHGQ